MSEHLTDFRLADGVRPRNVDGRKNKARKYGLDVPPYRLAEDGMVLVIDRFDLRMDGTYRDLRISAC